MEKDNEDQTFIAQKMIEIFCKTRLDYVMKMKWKDVQEIVTELGIMFEQDQKLQETVSLLNGVNYGFIPNLDEISFGEFVDLDSYLGDWQEMHKAMQVLYRPVDISVRGRYNIKEYTAVTDDTMKDMPLAICTRCSFFFNEFRQRVISSYDGLFDRRGVLKEHTPLKEGFNRKWGWYTSFYQAAQGDVTRFEHISEQRLHKILMYLEFVNEKQHIRESKNKKKAWQINHKEDFI